MTNCKSHMQVTCDHGSHMQMPMSSTPIYRPTHPHLLRSTCPHVHTFKGPLAHISTLPKVHSSTVCIVHSSICPQVYTSTSPQVHTSLVHMSICAHVSTVPLTVSRVRETYFAVAIVSYSPLLCHEHILHLSEERKLQLSTENARGDRPHSTFWCETYFETYFCSDEQILS